MELVQICSFVNANDFCTSAKRGAMANHERNAKKKETHAQ
jgi:hypothetical protein